MLKILCSKPFMVLAVAQMGNYWGYYTLMSGTPLYLSNILHFPLEQVTFLKVKD